MKTGSQPSPALMEKVLHFAREIWRRDPAKVRSKLSEDRRFREFFGCSAVVAISVWRRLEMGSQVPDGCTLKHLLWSLVFMKVYPKQQVMCTLVNVFDPKTFKSRVWGMIEAVSNLETEVVSVLH